MITTYYTTHDLDDYYTQLKGIPRLSHGEQDQLLAALAQSQQAQGMSELNDTQARHRLIEGHLGLATYIAATVRGTIKRVLGDESEGGRLPTLPPSQRRDTAGRAKGMRSLTDEAAQSPPRWAVRPADPHQSRDSHPAGSSQ